MKKWILPFIFLLEVSIAEATSVTYSLVTVGNPCNTNDPATGFGQVNVDYKIGRYDVTIQQYVNFLNAVAATDPYGTYITNMANNVNHTGILRSGSLGSYTYTVIGSSGNLPIVNVSWFDAARFANWMANGQPSGSEDATTTENGAYPLFGAVSGYAPAKNSVNPNTTLPPAYYIPLENEWVKAAYYDPTLNGGAGGYYLYATKSNVDPGNSVGSNANQVNYLSETTGYSVTQSPDFLTTQNYLTDVGAFTGSPSYYGTYDQTGEVWEWNDLDGSVGLARGLRGGAYTSTTPYLRSTYRMGYTPEGYNPNGGFRLAAPISTSMTVSGCLKTV